jgi:hypothetical protein
LFTLPRPVIARGNSHETARLVLATLRALAPAAFSSASIALQIFEGAALTR